MSQTPSEIAHLIYHKMMKEDHFSKWMDIRLLEMNSGYCKLEMTVRKEMLNGFGILHGGVTFAFADSAFAFASNSHDKLSVSLNATMTYSKSAKEGDILIAEAKQLTLGSRTGTFDVTVSSTKGETISLFRGTVFRTEQKHLDPDNQ